MDHLTCPVCGNSLQLAYRLRFNVYKCRSCGLLHSDATFEHSFQSDLESTSRDIGLKKLRLDNFAIIISELQKLKPGKLTGLEIGSGNGWWLETCRVNGIDCTGIEPERIYESYHKANNLNIIYGFYPDVSYKKLGGYDFIIFNDVFEHIPDINGLLENLRADLTDDGILIINIPMSTGFFYRIGTLMHKLGMSNSLIRLWQFNFHSPHMNYFNESNLKMLLDKFGFSCHSVLPMNTLDFGSIKERIMADKGMNKLKAAIMTTALTLLKPIIKNSEPDVKAFFFRKK
jgi:SAM-dependent methyltransferase